MKNLENRAFDDFLMLDFDQFGRIFEAKKAVEKLRKKNERLNILDVGGYRGNTKKLFPDDNVLIIDQYDVSDQGYIKADALSMPFQDNEFDVVLSFDVFEHIEDKFRKKFLDEINRVSKRLAVIAAPFYNAETEAAEILSNDFYKKLKKKDHPWLVEHIDNKLPKISQVEDYLRSKKLSYKIINNNPIEIWNLMQHYILLASIDSGLSAVRKNNSFYNKNVDAFESSARTSYRKIIFIGEYKSTSSSKKDISTMNIELQHRIFLDVADAIKSKNKHILALQSEVMILRELNNNITNSFSWKITRPLRAIKRVTRK